MKKILFGVVSVAALLYGAEFEFGSGSFKLKGGFVGLNSEISSDVKTYSLAEQHKNIFSSEWFYKYNITWISSNDMTQAQTTVNNALTSTALPSVTYKIRGLDANIVAGKDFVSEDSGRTYLSAGVLLGISIPYINSDNSDGSTVSDQEVLNDSDTEIKTYKLGLNLSGSKAVNEKLNFYISASYAYQYANIKNSDVDLDTDSDGVFEEYEAGVRFTPFKTKTKIWFVTLTPQVFFTAGYRYSYWRVNDVSINVSGVSGEYDKSDLEMKSSVFYVGAGYSF